jgi:hypothetical protein
VATGAGGNTFVTLTDAQMAQGKDAAVRATLDEFLGSDSTSSLPRVIHALYMGSRHWYDSAETDLRWIDQHSRSRKIALVPVPRCGATDRLGS